MLLDCYHLLQNNAIRTTGHDKTHILTLMCDRSPMFLNFVQFRELHIALKGQHGGYGMLCTDFACGNLVTKA